MASIVAGLSLAVILARGLALTTTTEKGMPFPKLVEWYSDELNYFSLNISFLWSSGFNGVTLICNTTKERIKPGS